MRPDLSTLAKVPHLQFGDHTRSVPIGQHLPPHLPPSTQFILVYPLLCVSFFRSQKDAALPELLHLSFGLLLGMLVRRSSAPWSSWTTNSLVPRIYRAARLLLRYVTLLIRDIWMPRHLP